MSRSALGSVLVLTTACTTYLRPEAQDAAAREQTGDIVITEIMADPTACDDEAAEWIEVLNRTDADIDINGMRLVDLSGTEVVIESERPLWAGEVMQIGRGEWDTFCVGQKHPYAYWGKSLGLNNDKEQLTLVDVDGTVLDQTPVLTRIEPGMSLSLDPEAFDGNDPEAWYLGSDCDNTFGTSPDVPNPPCLTDLGWFGLDVPGAALPKDFDPLPHLTEAHGIAQGILDRQADVDRDGVFFQYLRLENTPAVDPEDFVPGDAEWEVTFMTYGDDLWSRKNIYITLHINDGTYEIREDFASDSLANVRMHELDAVTMNATDLMEALDGSWGWWDDVGFATLSRASYQQTPTWIAVDDKNDDRESYDAVTGEKRR